MTISDTSYNKMKEDQMQDKPGWQIKYIFLLAHAYIYSKKILPVMIYWRKYYTSRENDLHIKWTTLCAKSFLSRLSSSTVIQSII